MHDLIYKLEKYGKSKVYPFHMPGHKRHMKKMGFKNPYKIDITEIEGFDDLHHAEGVLLEAGQRAARIYHSKNTYFLVNGSTSGILSAISAVTTRNGKIILARNSHKAAYHAVFLRQLRIKYVYPKFIQTFDLNGGISPKNVKDQLEQDSEIEAVFITSPTAEGIVSDIKEIALICHTYGKPLIVDEAHGAHFGFDKNFPKTSIEKGADIVISSVHKTLPAFTQSALLHVNGNIVNKKIVEEYLEIYQTSSPSYILMGGIDRCMSILETQHEKLFKKLSKNLEYFHNKTKDLQIIRILQKTDLIGKEIKDFDPGKLVISVQNTKHTGEWLQQELLHTYKIQMEMATPTYVVAIATIMDQKKGFKRLQKALRKIDEQLITEVVNNKNKDKKKIEASMDVFREIEVVYPSYQAKELPKRKILLKEATEMVSAEFVILYPPGIPLIVPGERMNARMLEQIESYKVQGLSIQGMHDKTSKWIEIVNK